MSYLLYLMFRCDRRCDGCDEKFGNFVENNTPRFFLKLTSAFLSSTNPGVGLGFPYSFISPYYISYIEHFTRKQKTKNQVETEGKITYNILTGTGSAAPARTWSCCLRRVWSATLWLNLRAKSSSHQFYTDISSSPEYFMFLSNA